MDREDFINKKLLAVYISLFIVALGFGVILPILPFYLERLVLGSGITSENLNFHMGLLTSTYPLFQMFFAPIWGRWSDRLGRKPLIIMGIWGFIMMQLVISISNALWMLYLARIIGGVFTSSIIPVGYALISDLTSTKNRAFGIALAGTSYSLGVVVGPFLGGLLSRTHLHLNYRLGHFHINDFSVPFFILTLLGLGLLPVVARWLKNTAMDYKTADPVGIDLQSWPQLVRGLSPYLFLSLIYQAALTLFEFVFSIYSKNELQYDAISIGYGFMVCALVMGLLQPVVVAKKISNVISNRNQVTIGFALFGIAIVLLVFSEQLVLVLILIGLLAAGGAFITPNITAFISILGKQQGGQALGIQNAVNSLGQGVGPIAGSWLLTLNTSLPYLVTGIILTVLALFLSLNKKLHSLTINLTTLNK